MSVHPVGNVTAGVIDAWPNDQCPLNQRIAFQPSTWGLLNFQRNLSTSGRFQGGGRGTRLSNGNGFSQQNNHRLRTPQNGATPSRSNFQQQPNPRQMSQRLGPINNHAPPPSKPVPVSYVKMLEEYFSQMGIGAPEFKTSKIEKKTSGSGKPSKKGSASVKFYSTVRVNNQSFQVWPRSNCNISHPYLKLNSWRAFKNSRQVSFTRTESWFVVKGLTWACQNLDWLKQGCKMT